MRGRRWLILAVLFAARAATGFQFQAIGSATNMLMRDLGLDYSQLGMLIGAYLLPGVIVAFPAGLLGERFREKTLGIVGLALMLASGIALADASGFATALVARTLGGIGATIVVLVVTKMTTDWFEGREIVLAMSLVQVSWPFGAMLALPVQAFIALAWGWPAVMLSGGLCAGAALCAFAVVAQSAAGQKPAAAREKLPAAVLLPVIVAGTAWGAMNLACILFFSYAPLLMTARGVAPTAAASLTSLAIWLTIVAIPSGGYLVHRLGKPITAIVVCAPVGACALIQFVAGIGPTTSCLLFGIAVGPLSGAILSLPASILAPRHRSFGFGVFYTCFYVLMAVGPLIAGRLQDAWASPAAALIAGAALLVAVAPLSLVFAALTRPRRLTERHGIGELHAAAPDGA